MRHILLVEAAFDSFGNTVVDSAITVLLAVLKEAFFDVRKVQVLWAVWVFFDLKLVFNSIFKNSSSSCKAVLDLFKRKLNWFVGPMAFNHILFMFKFLDDN